MGYPGLPWDMKGYCGNLWVILGYRLQWITMMGTMSYDGLQWGEINVVCCVGRVEIQIEI